MEKYKRVPVSDFPLTFVAHSDKDSIKFFIPIGDISECKRYEFVFDWSIWDSVEVEKEDLTIKKTELRNGGLLVTCDPTTISKSTWTMGAVVFLHAYVDLYK